MSPLVDFVVYGEPASKANGRRNVFNKKTGKMLYIKSKKALNYAEAFALQCPQMSPPIKDDVSVTITIFYASRRPDLDESLILDCMQSVVDKKAKTVVKDNIYLNDRQVKEKHIYWDIDKNNPRAEISVSTLIHSNALKDSCEK